MDAKSYVKWQKVADEFLNSELNETDFCKAKKLDIGIFRQRLSEVECYEDRKNIEEQEGNQFVELIPQGSEVQAAKEPSFLQVQFHARSSS